MFEVSSLTSTPFANPIFTQNPLDFSTPTIGGSSFGSNSLFSAQNVGVDIRFLHQSLRLQQELIYQNESLNEERSRLFALNNFNNDLDRLIDGTESFSEDMTLEEQEDLILRQRDLIDDLSDYRRESQFNGRALLDDPSLRSLTSRLNSLDFDDDDVFTEMSDILEGSSDLMTDLISNSENAIETQELQFSLTEGLQSTYLDLSQQFSSFSLSNLFDTSLISTQPNLAFQSQTNQLNSLFVNQLLLQSA